MGIIEHCIDQFVEEGDGCGDAVLAAESDKSDLQCPVDRDERIELAFLGADLGDVDVEEADRLCLELLSDRHVTVHLGQPADTVWCGRRRYALFAPLCRPTGGLRLARALVEFASRSCRDAG